MAYFRDDNTQGYSAADLAELNTEFTWRMNLIGGDAEEDKTLTDHIAQRVLAWFDDKHAPTSDA